MYDRDNEIRSIIVKSLEQGAKDKRITSVLSERYGLRDEEVNLLIRSIKESYGPQIRGTRRKNSLKTLARGFAVLVGGIVATVVTISISPLGVVFIGAMIFGVAEIIRGLVGLARNIR